MSHALMISAGIAVVLVVLLVLLRGRAVATKPMGRSQVAAVVAIAVLIAAGIDVYVMRQQAKAGRAASAQRQGTGPGMGMMGGGPGGGMGGGGMGGPREASPKRDLGRFVRKLVQFQQKGTEALDAKQAASLLPLLTALQGQGKMTEDEGKAQLEAVSAILTESQLAAVEAIELPRPPGGMAGMMGGGGMGGGMMGAPPGMGSADAPPAAQPAGAVAGGAPAAPGPDRAQAFRERLLAIPYVKEQYDAKVAEDSTFAQDPEKERAFLREVMREVSPFQQGSSKDALADLITALQDGETH